MAFELCINWSVGSLVYVNFLLLRLRQFSLFKMPFPLHSIRAYLIPPEFHFFPRDWLSFTLPITNCEKMDFSSRSLFFAGCCLQMDPQLLFSFFFCFAARPLRKQTLRCFVFLLEIKLPICKRLSATFHWESHPWMHRQLHNFVK